MILMIDNYDSFTYNLVQYVEDIGPPVQVVRNDAVTIDEIEGLEPNAVMISPGPGLPENAGISMDVIKKFSGKVPILGVCLGHQSIAAAHGGKITRARRLMHGKTSKVTCDGQGIFKGLKKPFQAMRYHSLAVARNTLPDCFTITAESDDGEIMGIRHKEFATEGIQFHPESIMTIVGKRLLRNFVDLVEERHKNTVLADE